MKKAEEIVRKKLERDDTLVDKDLFVQSLAEMKTICFTFIDAINDNLLQVITTLDAQRLNNCKLRGQISHFFTKIEELLG